MVTKFIDLYENEDNYIKKKLHNDELTYKDVVENSQKNKGRKSQAQKAERVDLNNQLHDPNSSKLAKADKIIQKFNDQIEHSVKASMKNLKKADNYKEETIEGMRIAELDEDDVDDPINAPKYEFQVRMHKEFTTPGRTDRDADMYNIREQAYDRTLYELSDELEYAIKERKDHSKQLALAMFDKIQKMELPNTSTLDAKVIEDGNKFLKETTREDLREELAKLKISLDDNTSPSVSMIKELHRQGFLGLDDSEVEKLINQEAETWENTTEKLENVYDELENKERLMVALQNAYDRKLQEYVKLENQPEKDIFAEKEEHVSNMLEKEIFEAYIDYQRSLLKENYMSNQDQMDPMQYTDQHKIDVVRRIFGVMETKQMNNFGTDLLTFGVTHDVPDAVRIGENIAGLNDEDVPDDINQKLKRYYLENSEKLRERINITGPMKGIVQNRKESLMRQEDRNGYIPSNMTELHEKYNTKYNRWRLPSIYTQDYSKRGQWDAILGKERLDKFEEFVKY